MKTPRVTEPARIYVLLARDAPSGAILRRGPSEWVQLIRWNTANDTFEPGHWFKGDIYNYKCDLSPSGDRLIYFAAKHGRAPRDQRYTGAWTAISRVPYLTAVALWPNRGDTHYGGGLFADENTVWLNSLDAVYFEKRDVTPHPNHQPPAFVTVIPNPSAFYQQNGEWRGLGLEEARRIRDGWTWHEDGKPLPSDILTRSDVPYPFPILNLYRREWATGWVLRLRQRNWYEAIDEAYFLRRERLAVPTEEPLEGVTWADFDQQGRLVCAHAGKLFAVLPPERRGELEWRELADFNESRPQPLPPPDWATLW